MRVSGTNWRMLEVQAVIGRIQLRRMADWHARRLANAQQLWDVAARLPALRVPAMPEGILHTAYKCYVFVEPSALKEGWDRDRILGEIVARGVPAFPALLRGLPGKSLRRYGLAPGAGLAGCQGAR
jgi:dTDP-4-amino-4,6-dideoxygalactose transaminase